MCFESLFIYRDGSRTDKGGSREMKVREAGEQGTGISPPPPVPSYPSPNLKARFQTELSLMLFGELNFYLSS